MKSVGQEFLVGLSLGAASTAGFFLLVNILKSNKKEEKLPLLRQTQSSRVLTDDVVDSKNFLHAWSKPVVIAMVGLPARGKSYIVTKLIRYLKWTGFQCKVFNVGSYRRKIGLASADSSFFEAGNQDSKRIRDEMAMAVQSEMYEWLHTASTDGRVAIFDATNTTKDRRAALAAKAAEENVFLLFIESICDDKETLERNYTLKLQNDDYKTMDPEIARADFMKRVHAYEQVRPGPRHHITRQ